MTPAWSVGRSERGMPSTTPTTRSAEATGNQRRSSAPVSKVRDTEPFATSRITGPSSMPDAIATPSGASANP